MSSNQIKVTGLRTVSTTINDQGCQHVTNGFESIRTLFKQVGRMAYIFSVASLSKNCGVIQKTIAT